MAETTTFEVSSTVGDIVTARPELSRFFEQLGIDYCCGGKKTIDEVGREKGIGSEELLAQLGDASATYGGEADVDVASMSLAELVDHIVNTHHAYLKSELPRISAMTEKVARVHGERNPKLSDVRDTFQSIAKELEAHTMKEEQILFPAIRQLDAGGSIPSFPFGSIAGPIGQMELEHDQVGAKLECQRSLTDNFVPPEWACNTYRAMIDALRELEQDLHKHIHKENNVLFQRTLELEQELEGQNRQHRSL